jgi:hypothetical protein
LIWSLALMTIIKNLGASHGSSSATSRLGCPRRRGSSLARACVHVNMRVHHLDRESRARLPRVWVCVSITPAAKESSPARTRLGGEVR